MKNNRNCNSYVKKQKINRKFQFFISQFKQLSNLKLKIFKMMTKSKDKSNRS